MDISLIIVLAFFAGSLFRVMEGWLKSGQSFDARKFFSTLIATVVVGIPVAVGFLGSNIVVDTGGLISLCLTAFGSGFAIDTALKQIPGLNKLNQGETANEK